METSQPREIGHVHRGGRKGPARGAKVGLKSHNLFLHQYGGSPPSPTDRLCCRNHHKNEWRWSSTQTGGAAVHQDRNIKTIQPAVLEPEALQLQQEATFSLTPADWRPAEGRLCQAATSGRRRNQTMLLFSRSEQQGRPSLARPGCCLIM